MTPDSSSSSVDDPLFESGHRIFANKDLLKIGHVPEADRIVGRDEEIEARETSQRCCPRVLPGERDDLRENWDR